MSLTEKWTKSTRSNSGGNCVEVRQSQNGNIQVRDSKNPNGPVLAFTSTEWTAFIGDTKQGSFSF